MKKSSKKSPISLILHLNDNPYLSSNGLGLYAEDFWEQLKELKENYIPSFSVYMSGSFIEASQKTAPSGLANLRSWIKDGSVECLGGGYYDPIFPLLPESSSRKQIEKLNNTIEKALGTRCRGFWLPSFVWENSMISLLNEFSYEYIVLRDYQLSRSLSRQTPKRGYWTMEDRGKLIRAIPSDSKISDSIRMGMPIKAIEQIKRNKSNETIVVDLPVFRSGRDSYEKEFFDYLKVFTEEAKHKKVELIYRKLSSVIDSDFSCGSVNLQSAVGKNMGLPKHLNSCRDLLVIQPECNYLHKRMLYLHKQIEQIRDKRDRDELENALLPSQRIFYYRNQPEIGGIRFLADRSQCEAIMLDVAKEFRKVKNQHGIKLEINDFLCNGSKQLLCTTDKFQCLLEHRLGGRLRSLDFLPLKVNLINGYREAEAENDNVYDVDPVSSFVDWFFPRDSKLDLESLQEMVSLREGVLTDSYGYQMKKQLNKMQILLSGEKISKMNGESNELSVEKVYSFSSSSSEIGINWSIINPNFQALKGFWGVELCISPSTFDLTNQYFKINSEYKKFKRKGSIHPNVGLIEFLDKKQKLLIKWKFVKECSLMIEPVYSKDVEEAKGERLSSKGFQYFRMFAYWPIELLLQEKLSVVTQLTVKKYIPFIST